MPEFFQRQPDGWYRKRYQHSPREWGCLVGTFYHLVATPPEGPGVHVSVETLVTKTASPLLQKTPFYCTFLDLQGYIYIYSYIDIRIYIYTYTFLYVHINWFLNDGYTCFFHKFRWLTLLMFIPHFCQIKSWFLKGHRPRGRDLSVVDKITYELDVWAGFCKGFTIEGWLQTLQKEIHPYCWWPQYLY